MDATEELTSEPTVPVCTGVSELQADEELDSKLVIMHCGGEPAVRMGFIPPVRCSGPALHHAGCEGSREPSTATPASLLGRARS